MPKIIYLFASLLLACLSPLAQGERLRIVSDDWAPYIYQDNGQPRGMHYEISREVFKRLGLDVQWIFLPWKRCLAMAEQGLADGVMGVFKVPERDTYLLYPEEPLSQVDFVLFQNRARPHQITRLEDLKGLTVGTSPGYNYSAEFDNAEGFKREPGPSHASNFGKLALGRIDLLITDRHVGRYLLQHLGFERQMEALPLVIRSRPQYLGMTRKPGREQLAQAFADELRRFKQEPAYRAIIARYEDENIDFPQAVEQHDLSTR